PPSSGVMKPNPLSSLKNLTVPCPMDSSDGLCNATRRKPEGHYCDYVCTALPSIQTRPNATTVASGLTAVHEVGRAHGRVAVLVLGGDRQPVRAGLQLSGADRERESPLLRL